MEEINQEATTYTLSIKYADERDTENIESLSKVVVKTIANTLRVDVEAKKQYSVIEVDEKDFYIFRMFDIKDIQSIDVDEE